MGSFLGVPVNICSAQPQGFRAFRAFRALSAFRAFRVFGAFRAFGAFWAFRAFRAGQPCLAGILRQHVESELLGFRVWVVGLRV